MFCHPTWFQNSCGFIRPAVDPFWPGSGGPRCFLAIDTILPLGKSDGAIFGNFWVPHHTLNSVLFFVECLLDAVYAIKMKWEPSNDSATDWCECRLSFQPSPTLLMKGVHWQHPACASPVPDELLWDRWIDHFSHNIRVVLASMVPNLTQKALILASSDLCRQINIASLIRGFSYKGYARAWWWKYLRGTLCQHQRLNLIPQYLVKKWVGEGRAFRKSLGPAGASHTAPALTTS